MNDETKQKLEDMKEHLDKEAKFHIFKIKYNNTDNNRGIHEAFVAYCWEECDGGYLMGIKRLLELASSDWKFEAISNEIANLKEELQSLKEQNEEKKEESKEEPKTF